MANLLYKELPFIDPIKILFILKDNIDTVFLDSSKTHKHYGRYSFITFNPVRIFDPNDSLSLADQLAEFEQLKKDLSYEFKDLPPFIGGLAGFLSYDFNQQLEPILANNSPKTAPDYWFGLYNQVFAFDYEQNKCYLIVTKLNNSSDDLEHRLSNLEALYQQAVTTLEDISNYLIPTIKLDSNFSKDAYLKAIDKEINYIHNGDIFEVNLAQCFSGTAPDSLDNFQLYQKLRSINSAPFSAYLNLGYLKILSASPERFLKVNDNQIEVRPIKGTIKSDLDPQVDKKLVKKLEESIKDRAENIMIVDLMRNDLSKICIPDTVIVNQLCKDESFTNLHHLVSVINGELKEKILTFDIIKACFPGGSITGAPKIRAMQIISELEPCARGIYCGSIGYFSLNGNIDLSIAIRTIIINKQNISLYSGGAITLQSNPEEEYQETMLKAQKMLEVFNQ